MKALVRPLVLAATTTGALAQEHGVRRPHGFVPDAATAVRIARAVWTPIYGKAAIARQRPHVARFEAGIWTVEGTLPLRMRGGTAIAVITQADGRILRVSHGR